MTFFLFFLVLGDEFRCGRRSKEHEHGLRSMSKARVHITVSADGYVAGPNPSLEHPLGEGGGSLHEWALPLRAFREPHGMDGGEVSASTPVVEESLANVGAEIMGRGKFGGGPGP
jgi:hypothetical protein